MLGKLGKSCDAMVQAVLGEGAGGGGRLHTDTCTETAGARLHCREADFALMHLPKWLKGVSTTFLPLLHPHLFTSR